MAQLDNIGLIHFDIPDRIKRFANRLRRHFRKGRSLPVSMSVYLVNWSDTPAIKQIIDEARAAYSEKYPEDADHVGRLVINVLKVDDATAEESYQMAVAGLSRLIAQIGASLSMQIKKLEKEGEVELPRSIQVRFVKKLQEVEGLAVAFRLMDDVETALESVREAVTARIGAKVAAKYLKTETAKA